MMIMSKTIDNYVQTKDLTVNGHLTIRKSIHKEVLLARVEEQDTCDQ